MSRRIDLLDRNPAEETLEKKAVDARETAVRTAIKQAHSLLPRERQIDLKRMEDSAVNARRMANLSLQARNALLGDRDTETRGMVIASRTDPPCGSGWPC